MLDRADVDTDQIIPKQFLKRIERTGLRRVPVLRLDEGSRTSSCTGPSTRARRSSSPGATSAAARRASTRPWALEDYGFRAVLAPSFADIFRTNAVKTGLAPLELPEAAARRDQGRARASGNELTVDLEALEITHPDGLRIPFELDEYARETLLHGLDDVARTLRREERIAAYEAATPARFDTTALAG